MGEHGVGCAVGIFAGVKLVLWRCRYPKFHMALWCAIALAWLILGANSSHVPWGTNSTWLLANALVAGSALGVAYRRTASSLLVYLIASLIAGSCRSLAYLTNGSSGPGWVWLIVALTNVVLLGHWRTENAR